MADKVPINWFVEQLLQAVKRKDGYIMGATGQDPKKWGVKSYWYNQYTKAPYTRKHYNKALYWRENAQRVWDCNGLSEGLYKDYTGVDINTKARYNYLNWCDDKGTGVIPKSKRKPGMAVFKQGSSSYIHHVGYIVGPVNENDPQGDQYIAEAKGVLYGVVRTKLSDGGWDRWGKMSKYFDYDEPIDESMPDLSVSVEVTGHSVLAKGDQGKEVILLQKALLEWDSDCLPKYGADGDFGAETLAAVLAFQAEANLVCDGIVGPSTWNALENVGADEITVTGGVVNVRENPGVGQVIVTTAHKGDVYTYTETRDVSGITWYHIAPGWISGKYAVQR